MTFAERPWLRWFTRDEGGSKGRGRLTPVFGAVCATCALAAGFDRLASGGTRPALAALQAAGLGVLAGGTLGTLIAVIHRIVRRLPGRSAFGIWLACLGSPCAWLLVDLDAWAKVRSGHAAPALVAFSASLSVAAALALGFARVDAPKPWRAVWLAVLGLSLFLSDLLVLPGNYLAVHDGLRVGTLLVASLLLLSPRWSRPSLPVRSLLLCLGVGLPALSLSTLNERNTQALRALLGRPYAGLALRAARRLLDVDFDGSSSFLGGGDCAPFDPNVGPLSSEIPGNGIDDNCLGGDAPIEKPVAREADVPIPSAPSPISVVLVTVDALRADHLGLYGYGRPTSAHLDAWARDALVFDRAVTSGGTTSIAIPSMLRGIYARRLTYATFFQEMPPHAEGPRKVFRYGMAGDDPYIPLPRWLARRGMETLSVTWFGRFLSAVDAVFPRERLAVMVTGDHGEELVNAHLRNHGLALEDADIHVPLLLRERPVRRISTASISPDLFHHARSSWTRGV